MNTSILPNSALCDKQTPVGRPKRRKDRERLLTGKRTRLRTGDLRERSEMLSRDRAKILFAAMAHLPTIECAELQRSHRLRSADTDLRYYVRYRRASGEMTDDQVEAQDIRIERAVYQFSEMEFIEIAESDGWHWTIHAYPDSPLCGIYRTHIHEGCSCPDFYFRRRLVDGKCKHQKDLAAHLGLPIFFPGRANLLTPEERREWVQAHIMEDF